MFTACIYLGFLAVADFLSFGLSWQNYMWVETTHEISCGFEYAHYNHRVPAPSPHSCTLSDGW
jgi:hypothetical protein